MLHHKSAAELLVWLTRLESDAQLQEVLVYSYRPEQVFAELVAKLPMIDAAGGVVWKDKKALFIFRHNKWDLPKGKIEVGEAPDLAAMREVEEECGVGELQLGRFIGHTYHTYRFKQEMVIKRTYWYEMTTAFEGALVPQQEEGITEVCWLSPVDWPQTVYSNTYLSIADLLQNQVEPQS
ncbi:MAG: NUDIX domain-containing protein [Sphingobacteriaceae bacterium]|nr:NUDIX domain-containing protein [Sphingobacteriaceae bacterium]